MNRGQIGAGGEDPVVRALTHIFEKAALVNYKQIYAQLGGMCTATLLCKPLVISLSLSFSLSLSS